MPRAIWMLVAVVRMSMKFAGRPPASASMSLVARPSPAPLTTTPMSPCILTKLMSFSRATRSYSSRCASRAMRSNSGWR